MSKVPGGAGSAVAIGEVATPPFVRLPEPSTHFRLRAQRFAVLSQHHGLGPYLRFMAGLAEAQHRAQEGLPQPVLPEPEALARAHDFAMPPLDRAHGAADEVLHATMDRLFDLATQIDMPPPAREALERVSLLSPDKREQMASLLLLDVAPAEAVAEHVYVAAALQLHFARLASRLDAARLVPVGEGACPACGGPPVSSMVVGWQGASGTRFSSCSLCATQWHVVRIKCTLCGTTEGIGYQAMEGEAGEEGLGTEMRHVQAETCESCRAYVKILHQHKVPAFDPVADDVASLGLDLLMRESGYRRGGVNPYLFGY